MFSTGYYFLEDYRKLPMGRFTSRSGGQNCTQSPLKTKWWKRPKVNLFFLFWFVFRGYRRKEELRLLLSLWLFHSFVSLSAAIAEPSNIIQHLIYTRLALSVSLSFSILFYLLISIRFLFSVLLPLSVCLYFTDCQELRAVKGIAHIQHTSSSGSSAQF
jgi:hypothetical protein